MLFVSNYVYRAKARGQNVSCIKSQDDLSQTDGQVSCVTAQTANLNLDNVIHSTDSTPVVVQMG